MLRRFNKYDIFIIVVIASMVMGTVNFWIFYQHVFAAALSVPVIVKKMMQFQHDMRLDNISCYIITLLLWAGFSLCWTIDEDGGYGQFFILLCNLFIFIGIYFASEYANMPLRSICYGWILLLCLSFPVAVWEMTTGNHIARWGDYNDEWQLMGADGTVQNRVFAAVTFRNLNTYGTVLCSALPFVFSGCFIMKRRLFPLCVALIAIVLLIINSSRASMGCVIVNIFFFILYFRKERFRHKFLWGIVVLLLVFAGLYEFSSVLFNQIAGRVEGVSFGDAARWAVIEYGLKSIAASYGIGWGVGAMQEAYLMVGYTWMLYSHNFVIEFMLEYGIPICLLFLFLYVKSIVRMYMTRENVFRFLSLSQLFSFVPWAIINDSYLEFNFVWAMFVSLFVFYRYRWQSEIQKC